MGIRYFGRQAGWQVFDTGGLRLALFAFTEWINGSERVQRAAVNCETPSQAEAEPPACDLAVMMPHWGNEFRFRPEEHHRELARSYAKAGCDLVISTHPHVIQPLEMIGKTLIVHSLGDFLGTTLPRTPWPQHLSLAIACDAAPGHRLTGYEAHVYFREKRGGHERLMLIGELPGDLRERAEGLADRIMRPALTSM